MTKRVRTFLDKEKYAYAIRLDAPPVGIKEKAANRTRNPCETVKNENSSTTAGGEL